MNIYLVPYVLKGAGYSEGDEVTSGGSFDKHFEVVVTASSARRAKAAIVKMLGGLEWKITVRPPILLGKA